MSYLTLEVTRRILTLSSAYSPPKGGIAQVVQSYSTMYPEFNHVATKKGDSSIEKLWSLTLSLFVFLYFCFCKDIRIVHVHGASNNSFRRKRVFINIAKFLGKKVVYHVHGAEFKEFYRCHPKQVEALFKRVDITVALSESWKLFFESAVGHKRVRIIENVVPQPTIRIINRDGRVHFLFLGELGRRKGIYDLLDSIADNVDYIKSKAVFHIGGSGEVEKVMQRISELGLEETVIFEGWVTGEKKIDLLNLADVYILPSYNEGLPVSILEAMSYRLPIISTPVGGIPEVVIENENGILVEPGNKTATGRAIIRMIENESFRRKAGEASFNRVKPYFPENVAEKLDAMYRELLEV